jgi:hypothetical protein
VKKSALFFAVFIVQTLAAQNVGIGTAAPLAKLHVADSSVLFSAAPFTVGGLSIPVPVNTTGARLLWFTPRFAFKVGYASAENWNKDSIGLYSFSAGYDTRATAGQAVALGYQTIASGGSSTALGVQTIASGGSSTAMGYLTVASGLYSLASGIETISSNNGSTAMGFLTYAGGQYSFAAGTQSYATGSSSTAIGTFLNASGDYSTALGYSVSTNGKTGAFIIGDGNPGDYSQNDTSNQMLTRFGGGYKFLITDNAPALIIHPSGKIGIGTTTPRAPLSFYPSVEEKITFWDDGNVAGGNYGIGVQSGLLQIHSYTPADDIAFGYGSSENFTERFRIKGNGALAVQGNAGTAGQVLTSNGSATAPAWKNSAVYFRFENPFGGIPLVLTNAYQNVPIITGQTFTLNSNATVIINVIANLQVPAGSIVQEPDFFFWLTQSGSPVTDAIAGYRYMKPQPATFIADNVTMTRYWTLNAGTYTLDFRMRKMNTTGGTCQLNGAQIIIPTIP